MVRLQTIRVRRVSSRPRLDPAGLIPPATRDTPEADRVWLIVPRASTLKFLQLPNIDLLSRPSREMTR